MREGLAEGTPGPLFLPLAAPLSATTLATSSQCRNADTPKHRYVL